MNASLYEILGVAFAQISAVLLGYFKLKSQLARSSADVKNHADVCIQKLNGTLTNVINSFDRPCWVKTAIQNSQTGQVEFRMLEVNEPYCEAFGIKRQDYLGKTDLEAGWNKKMADEFYQHDLQVWASGEPQSFVEKVNGADMRFRKVRVQTPDGRKKGVMGYGIDCGNPDGCPVYAKKETI